MSWGGRYHAAVLRKLFTAATTVSLVVAFVFALAYLFLVPKTSRTFSLGHGVAIVVYRGDFFLGTDRWGLELPLFVWSLPFAVLPSAYLIVALCRERRRNGGVKRGFEVGLPK